MPDQLAGWTRASAARPELGRRIAVTVEVRTPWETSRFVLRDCKLFDNHEGGAYVDTLGQTIESQVQRVVAWRYEEIYSAYSGPA